MAIKNRLASLGSLAAVILSLWAGASAHAADVTIFDCKRMTPREEGAARARFSLILNENGTIAQKRSDPEFDGVRFFRTSRTHYARHARSAFPVEYGIWSSLAQGELPALWLGIASAATDLIVGGQADQLGQWLTVEELEDPTSVRQPPKAVYLCSRFFE